MSVVELVRSTEKEVELKEKIIQLNDMTIEETMQIVKEKDIIVPDEKPDVNKIINIYGAMVVDQIEAQDDRVVYKGKIDIDILYTTAGADGKVYSIQSFIPVEDFVIMEGVKPGQKVEMEYDIENIHWNVLHERKINVKAIVKVVVSATNSKQETIVVGIEGKNGIQTQVEELSAVQPARYGYSTTEVKDELTIMQDNDGVKEILKIVPTIVEEQLNRESTKMTYSGIIEVKTLYKGQSEGEPLQVATHRIPFNEEIEIFKDDEEVYWDMELDVNIVEQKVEPDFDGEDRILSLKLILGNKYRTYNKINEKIISDVYLPNKDININKKYSDYMSLIARAKTITPRKDVVPINEQISEQNKITQVIVKPLISMKEIQGDKLTIEGMAQLQVMYIAGDDKEPLKEIMDAVPFTQEFILNGITPENYLDISIKVKNVSASVYSKTDIVVEYVLDTTVSAFAKETMGVIDEIKIEDMKKEQIDSYPSITVYVIRKGDTLWDIAKKFNTTVQDIEDINEIESGVSPNQKIIIMKKQPARA